MKPSHGTHSVPLGKYFVGGNFPILLQTMLRSSLSDEYRWRQELDSVLSMGCDVVRLAIPHRRALESFMRLRRGISDGSVTWIGDLHFHSSLALDALEVCDKVRINPGNFATGRMSHKILAPQTMEKEREHVAAEAKKFFCRAKQLGRSVRIGNNGGCIAERHRISSPSMEFAAIDGAMEMAKWAEEVEFYDLIFSFKWSDVLRTIRCNELARSRLYSLKKNYPFHLGVTETGNGMEGRIRGAIGIGVLLSENIGETVRLSLTESPADEIRFAKKLLKSLQQCPFALHSLERKSGELLRQLATFPSGQCVAGPSSTEMEDYEDEMLQILGNLLGDGDVDIGAMLPRQREVVRCAMQTCRLGKFRGEIIACPACGRAQYDVGKALRLIKQKFSHLTHLKIAVMGCVVNGPGEMADADYGYIGGANGKVHIYCHGQCIFREIDESIAIDALERLIVKNGDDHEPNGPSAADVS
ncbi:MAG: flavodoxin-dependent (E)-4-hydroxy-3-methylbut-2-enyl-diphosphate synthase [Puniceicoccales bacterium]|jgi:(E)-4-hydroxy-3-methylbut-2-enyl-diphosphate synthase|nr:flavodoxin-dependent (E)-4-hydroxy-3-methylbut-2-enyl-diphosphate synthase [Puniceicoccales bacterium]